MTVEPVLVSVGSCYCTLSLYESLRSGDARSAKSLILDYDKSPPHFQPVRALRAGRFGLAALTSAIFLANVLAVALSGIFTPITAVRNTGMEIKTFRVPSARGGFTDPTLESFYALADNLANGKEAPTWTTPQYYVMPFYPLAKDNVETYTGRTIGIGIDVKCTVLPPSTLSFSCNETVGCSFVDPSCWNPKIKILDPCAFDERLEHTLEHPSLDIFQDYSRCPGTFFAAWIEQPGDPNPRDLSLPYKSDAEFAALKCMIKDLVDELTTTVSDQYQVRSVADIRPVDRHDIETMHFGILDTFSRTFASAMVYSSWIRAQGLSELCWFDYFIATLDPSIPRHLTNVTHLPDTKNLAKAFADVY